jgi:hypothetical protein
MWSQDNILNWRIGYAFCCLIYVVWMVSLSLNNFSMVHGDYQRGGVQLESERIREIARRELVDQCRGELKRTGRPLSPGDKASAAADDPCLSWPPAVLEERQKAVARRLVEEQHGGGRKLLVFYVFFAIFVLILPPVALYLLICFFIWIFRSIKIDSR